MYENPLAYRDQKLRSLALAAAVFMPLPAVAYVISDPALGIGLAALHVIVCWGLAMAGYQLGQRNGKGARFAGGMALIGLGSPALMFLFIHLGEITVGR
jgi:putative Mn2+ efflux pump MntP